MRERVQPLTVAPTSHWTRRSKQQVTVAASRRSAVLVEGSVRGACSRGTPSALDGWLDAHASIAE